MGKTISEGHAFEKHVIKKGEFKEFGIKTPEDFAKHIDDVVSNAKDMGTAFRPTKGRAYFDGLE